MRLAQPQSPQLRFALTSPVIDYQRVNYLKVIYSNNIYNFFSAVSRYVSHPLLWEYLDKDVPAYRSLLVPDKVQNITVKRYQLLFQIKKGFQVYNHSVFKSTFPINYGAEAVPLIGTTLISEIMTADIQDEINHMIQDKIHQFTREFLSLLVPFVVVITLLLAFNVILFILVSRIKYEITNLFQLIKKSILEHDLGKLAKVQLALSSQPHHYIRAYNFNIYDQDTALERIEKEQEKIHKQMQASKKSNLIAFPKFSVLEVKEFAYMALYALVFYVLLVVQYTDVRRYVSTFSKSSQLLQDFYNAQIYGNQLCMYREFLYSYFISVKWLHTVYHRDQYLDMFKLYLNKLDYFNERQLLADYDFLDSGRFKELQLYLTTTDLCENVLDLTYSTKEICRSMLNGALSKGLTQTLSQIVADFRTEYQTTDFNVSLRNPPTPPLDQIYGSFYSSGVIKMFTTIINDSMEK